MKKPLFLLTLPLWLDCNKDHSHPAQDISGDYSTDVHYLHTWMTGMYNSGTVLDTNYSSPFHIDYHNDTITATYTRPDGAGIKEQLRYREDISGPDTLQFTGIRNGFTYITSGLSFYKNAARFSYTRYEHTNPSGGGNSITYTISSR